MLITIRSNINNIAVFKKGDKLVCANVLESGTIEYIINRPVKTFVIRSRVLNKYIKQEIKSKKHKIVDLVDDATFFKSYKAAKAFLTKELGEDHPDMEIIEVTE